MATVELREGSMLEPAISGVVLEKFERKYQEVVKRIINRINLEFPTYNARYYESPGFDFGGENKGIATYRGLFKRRRKEDVLVVFDNMRCSIKCTVYVPQIVPILKEELGQYADDLGVPKVVINKEF